MSGRFAINPFDSNSGVATADPAERTSQKTLITPARTFYWGIFCALIFLACFWVAWPVAQMGFVDDWSYIETARVFAKTGHFVYNGWATAMLGWQIPWGALFIKLFGFSFMTVKLSILPIAVAALLLFHAILIRFEITPRNAVIGTLTLGLSPWFMPLSASYMSDVPGLFVILLCLYCCQRALAAGNVRFAIMWLVFAAASNVVGGTARQVAWLGALVMVPCTAWLLRKHKAVVVTTFGLWVCSLAGVLYCLHWFDRQPYSIQMPLLPKLPHSVLGATIFTVLTADRVGALLLCVFLMIFPVLVAWLPGFGRKFDHHIALFCLGLLPMVMSVLILGKFAEIWPPHILFKELSVRMDAGIGWVLDGQRSLIPIPVQIVISLVVLAALFGCLFTCQKNGWKIIQLDSPAQTKKIVWLLVPFALAYGVLVVSLVCNGLSFDRYLLGVIPCAIIGSLWLYQKYVGLKLPTVSIAVLVFYALFAMAGTHDWFAWQRARLAAIHEVRATGVPRTEIQGGFEYDGWTQVRDGGHMNDPRIKIPPNAFKPSSQKIDSHNVCASDESFATPFPEVPDVKPVYSIAVGMSRCFLPSNFPPVHYVSWIPPFHRTIAIQKVKAPAP